jgi:hypothetical protein
MQWLRQCQEREELTGYIPPEYALDIAHERIGGMVRYFLEWVRDDPWWRGMDHVERLATSAYLQGIEDCAVAMAKKGYKLEGL